MNIKARKAFGTIKVIFLMTLCGILLTAQAGSDSSQPMQFTINKQLLKRQMFDYLVQRRAVKVNATMGWKPITAKQIGFNTQHTSYGDLEESATTTENYIMFYPGKHNGPCHCGRICGRTKTCKQESQDAYKKDIKFDVDLDPKKGKLTFSFTDMTLSMSMKKHQYPYEENHLFVYVDKVTVSLIISKEACKFGLSDPKGPTGCIRLENLQFSKFEILPYKTKKGPMYKPLSERVVKEMGQTPENMQKWLLNKTFMLIQKEWKTMNLGYCRQYRQRVTDKPIWLYVEPFGQDCWSYREQSLQYQYQELYKKEGRRNQIFNKFSYALLRNLGVFGVIENRPQYMPMQLIYLLMNQYKHAGFLKQEGNLIKVGYDWDEYGFAPISSKGVQKYIPADKLKQSDDILKEHQSYLKRDDFFAQLVIHDSYIQSILTQFDINPKLKTFGLFKKDMMHELQFNRPNLWKRLPAAIKNQLKTLNETDLDTVLNTDKLGTVLPTIPKKYGKNQPLDMVVTMNTGIFREGADSSTPLNGITIGKNGEIKLNMNFHVDLRLKSTKESIRHFYIPIELKGKGVEPLKYDNKTMSFKSDFLCVDAGIKNLKVFSLNPPKLEKNEAMLIQSAIGLQINQVVKQHKGKNCLPSDLKYFPGRKRTDHSELWNLLNFFEIFGVQLASNKSDPNNFLSGVKLRDGAIEVNMFNQGNKDGELTPYSYTKQANWAMNKIGRKVLEVQNTLHLASFFHIETQWDDEAKKNDAVRDKTDKSSAMSDKKDDGDDDFDEDAEEEDDGGTHDDL